MNRSEISLDNFADWHGKVNGVEMHSYIQLPEYAPAADITVDLGRIATIARFGRLRSVRFGLYDEEESMNVSVGGVNQDGSATAAAAKSASVSRASTEIHHDSARSPLIFPRGTASIKINASHPDLNDAVLRKPEPWAKLLDKGMRTGLKTATAKQLFEPKTERKVLFGINQALYALIAGGNYAIFQDPQVIAIVYGIVALDDATGMMTRISTNLNKLPYPDYEHSFIRDMPLDRYAAARTLAASRKIVSAK